MTTKDLLENAAKILSSRGHWGCHDWYVVTTSDESIVCGEGVEEYLGFNEAIEAVVGYAVNLDDELRKYRLSETEHLKTVLRTKLESEQLKAEVERLKGKIDDLIHGRIEYLDAKLTTKTQHACDVLKERDGDYSERKIASLEKAARDLCEHLNYPSYISNIGVGGDSIKVYIKRRLSLAEAIPKTWMGHPVEVVASGPIQHRDDTKGSE